VVFEEKRLTYKTLNQQSNQLAHYLQSRHAIPEGFQVPGKAPAQTSSAAYMTYVSSGANRQHSQNLTNSSGTNLDARSDPEGVKSRTDFIKGDGYINKNSLIALCMEHSEQIVISILATFKVGAAYVPLDPSHPAERIAYILKMLALILS